MNRARHINEQQVEIALHLLGSAQPSAELQSRILARIATAPAGAVSRPTIWRFFYMPRLAFGAATAVLASAVIIAGSVEHSRHITLPTAGVQLAPAGSGLGTASAAHLATQPVKAANDGRGRSRQRTARGRASLTKRVPKPAGVAVPDSPDLRH